MNEWKEARGCLCWMILFILMGPLPLVAGLLFILFAVLGYIEPKF